MPRLIFRASVVLFALVIPNGLKAGSLSDYRKCFQSVTSQSISVTAAAKLCKEKHSSSISPKELLSWGMQNGNDFEFSITNSGHKYVVTGIEIKMMGSKGERLFVLESDEYWLEPGQNHRFKLSETGLSYSPLMANSSFTVERLYGLEIVP